MSIRTKRIIHAVVASASTLGFMWTQAYATTSTGIFITYRTLALVFAAGIVLSAGWGAFLGGRNRNGD